MAWYGCFQRVSARDLDDLEKRIRKRMDTQQQQIDNITTKLSAAEAVAHQIATNVATIKTGIDAMKLSMAAMQQQILALQNANPTLDLTGLQTAADAVAGDVATVGTATEAAVADLPTPA